MICLICQRVAEGQNVIVLHWASYFSTCFTVPVFFFSFDLWPTLNLSLLTKDVIKSKRNYCIKARLRNFCWTVTTTGNYKIMALHFSKLSSVNRFKAAPVNISIWAMGQMTLSGVKRVAHSDETHREFSPDCSSLHVYREFEPLSAHCFGCTLISLVFSRSRIYFQWKSFDKPTVHYLPSQTANRQS